MRPGNYCVVDMALFVFGTMNAITTTPIERTTLGDARSLLNIRDARHWNRPDTRLQQTGCRMPRDATARSPWPASVPSFLRRFLSGGSPVTVSDERQV